MLKKRSTIFARGKHTKTGSHLDVKPLDTSKLKTKIKQSWQTHVNKQKRTAHYEMPFEKNP